ncbi:DEAD/DEAH box helicase [Aphelenchoides fujianensis]|nr:DEAD/DEAH box helicase [Aphelenchoides fujianensis]
MDVVGITPPGRGSALGLALIATQRVDPHVRRLQVLVVDAELSNDIGVFAYAFGSPTRIGVVRCQCSSDDVCKHSDDDLHILVHSPTASTQTTIAERCMESDALRMVVVHRVDELLAADRAKIFAILRAKPPHVQLVITAAEMTPDILRIARDFMPPRAVGEDRSPAVISMTKEGLQIASYSLVNDRLESKVHVDATRFDTLVTTATEQRLGALSKVPTEPRDLSALPPFEIHRFVPAEVLRGLKKAEIRLRDYQKAHLHACMSDRPNALIRGPPGSGKSTTVAIAALRAVQHTTAKVDVVILVPNVERAQKFKTLLETLGKYAKPLIYVCESGAKAYAERTPAIVIGKPRQIRQLFASRMISADLKLVVFAQVHEMIAGDYREDPREVLRSLPAFVHLLATSDTGDAATVREIDEFFNGDPQLRDDRLAATKRLGRFADYRLGPTTAAIAHDTLMRVVTKLSEFAASSSCRKNGSEPQVETEKSNSEADEAEAERKMNGDEKPKSDDRPLEVPIDNGKKTSTNEIERNGSEAVVEEEAKLADEQPNETSEEKVEATSRLEDKKAKRWALTHRWQPLNPQNPPPCTTHQLQSQKELDRLHRTFADFGLKIPLVLALFQSGLSIPRPLQQRALPALLGGKNLVIEAPPGAGKTTAVMIALLNELDPENDGLQALCLARTGEEVVRLRDQMEEIASKLNLRIGACEDDPVDKQLVLKRRDAHAHVFIGTNVHFDSCHLPRMINFSPVTHFVAFERGIEPDSEGIGFVGGAGLYQDILRLEKRPVQTILVTERVTDEVIDVCKRMKVDFSLIAMPGREEETREEGEADGQPKKSSQDSAASDDFVHVELPPTSSTNETPEQTLPIASTSAAPVVPLVRSPSTDRSTTAAPCQFDEFNLRPELLNALKKLEIPTMFPLERRALHAIFGGRNAVIDLELKRFCGEHLSFSTLKCVGGTSVTDQLKAIGSGVQVLIGTVQRVEAIVESEQFDRQALQFVVFDETEELLRTGSEMVHSILRRLRSPNVQVVLMAREESKDVDQTARKFLKDPLFLSKDGERDESQPVDRKEEGETSGQQPTERTGRESSSKPSSEESASLSTSSSCERALVEVDSRRTTVRMENEEDDGEQQEAEEGTVVEEVAEEADEGAISSPTVHHDNVNPSARREPQPTESLASQLAAAQLRGQLLENRLKELRIYELEEKLGLAHGTPVEVLPPN